MNFHTSNLFLCYILCFFNCVLIQAHNNNIEIQHYIKNDINNDMKNDNKYVYCKDDERITSYEFQLALDELMFVVPDLHEVASIEHAIQDFVDGSQAKTIAIKLLQDFISFSNVISIDNFEPRQVNYLLITFNI